MKLVDADASAEAEGAEELEGKANYFVGDDPSKWRTNVPTFGRVRYSEIYRGVDVVYYGNQRQLEYDFRVAPGADARAVSLEFEGADKVEVSDDGELLLTLGESVVRQPKPFVYQEAAGARRAVEGGYAIDRSGRVRFELGEYDVSLPLVIDPVLVYSTYLGGLGGEVGQGIAVDASGNAYVAGGVNSTDFPVVNPIQSTYAGSDFGLAGDAFVLKLSDTTSGPASPLQFTSTTPTVQEDVTFVTLTVQRTGDTTGPVTVDYATADGTASERSDYTTAVGTLRFAAGETSKTIDVLVNEDSKIEGNETFTVNLSNPTGGATLSCLTATATIQITDDAVEPTSNVIDDPTIFVGTHYHDFLNRQADAGGQAFWTGQITSCGANGPCVDNKRTNVSQAFFLSIEFEQTGFYAFRFYKASFTDSAARPRGLPRYREFLRDTQEIGRGVIVGVTGWEAQLEANKQEFARRWVQRPEFLSEFPAGMTAEAFVDKLFMNAGVTPTTAERAAAIAAFGAGDTDGRAAALRSVADSGSVFNKQFNPAFVLSQYIGYLRRNPNDAPEPGLDYAGFDFWLAKLDGFSQPGEDVRDPLTAQRRVQRAEMVRAFLVSGEYRQMFGP